jgi:quercetin dioxygenase-like cupin family protein
MKVTRTMAAAVLLAATVLTLPLTRAQVSRTERTELQRHDLTSGDTEVVQVRDALESGPTLGRHWHPGAEIVYVIEGTLEYRVDGRLAARLTAGDVLFIPARTIHAAKKLAVVSERSSPRTSSRRGSRSSCW